MKLKHHNFHWRYKNLILTFISILLAVSISKIESIHQFLAGLGNFGYVSAFIAGGLFVSTFTVAPGAIILFFLAETFTPWEIGLFAGLGAVVGDLTIFKFVKTGLAGEITDIYNHVDTRHHLKKLFHSRYFSWTLPVVGALIIASPLPDELGVTLMGISRLNSLQFLIISFFLNSIGIFLIISGAALIK
ncbi:hypothetical protein HYU89_01895 [Candidatus Collierbacteria bacterium]|nr:hypothetical protein [Candidatus Collierbacteria bacterium]